MMRNEIVTTAQNPTDPSGGVWLDLETHARVRLTSEDGIHPIEGALQHRPGHGWRAVLPGAQTIWIDFNVPQAIREIHLRFDVAERRTQELVLIASTDSGRSYREIVRQQFNFSAAAMTQDEHYFPRLTAVTDLKLTIVPDISGRDARATLTALRVR